MRRTVHFMFGRRVRGAASAFAVAAIGIAVTGGVSLAQDQPSSAGLTGTAGTVVALDDSSCPGNYSCFWTNTGFTGTKVLRGAEWAGTGYHDFDNIKRSVKNRFANKVLCYKTGGPLAGIVGWILPGNEDNANNIAKFKVLNSGQGTSNC